MSILLSILLALPLLGQNGPSLTELPADRLVPGDGWSAPTTAQVYPGTHADAVSIAKWTRAPGQIIWRETPASGFRIGVLAYHRSGIDRVRMAVDGGPWLDVTEMTRSSQTRHYEYSALLLPSDFRHGWHEVRAVAVPRGGSNRGGTERVLTWRFYNGLGDQPDVDYERRWVDPANGSDSNQGTQAAPFASLRRALDDVAARPDGAVVHLRGIGPLPIDVGGSTTVIDNEVPITIRRFGPVPRLAPQSGGQQDLIQVRNLRIEAINVDLSWSEMFDRGAAENTGTLLISRCNLQGYTEPAGTAQSFASLAPATERNLYLVDSRVRDARAALLFEWGRGLVIEDIIGTTRVQGLIDSDISTCNAGFDSNLAFARTFDGENGLFDGLTVTGNLSATGPVSGGTGEGTAIVNCLFDATGNPSFVQLNLLFDPDRRHFLLLHDTFVDTHVEIETEVGFGGDADFEHGLVFGVVAGFFNDPSRAGFRNNVTRNSAGLEFDTANNHTLWSAPGWSTWTSGTLATTFVDTAEGDYRVLSTSGAASRIPLGAAYVPFDRDARRRGALTAVGALLGEGE